MDVMSLINQSQAVKPTYVQEFLTVQVMQVIPAPKLDWTDPKTNEIIHKSNVTMKLEDGRIIQLPIFNHRIKDNGKLVAGSQALATVRAIKLDHDTKNFKSGTEIASLSFIEVLVGGDQLALANAGAIININNRN